MDLNIKLSIVREFRLLALTSNTGIMDTCRRPKETNKNQKIKYKKKQRSEREAAAVKSEEDLRRDYVEEPIVDVCVVGVLK